MVNNWTLEFSPGEVPAKRLAAYSHSNALSAGYMLCMVQMANVVADTYFLLSSLAVNGGRITPAEECLLASTLSTDLILGVAYISAYILIRNYAVRFRGTIAVLCVAGIVVQTEAQILSGCQVPEVCA